ncbi:MAG: DUF6364 family protein [Variibacter sp.]
MTKNLTLAVDEDVLDRVRVIAAERKTTVNGLVRAYLEQVAAADDKKGRFRRRIKALRARTRFEVGPVTWTRDELHER